MKFALPLLALAGTTFAHNFVTHFHINGVADPDCVRQAASADPILDIYSSDMACNAVQGLASKKCVVQGGDAIGFEWRVDRNIAPADYPLKDGSIPVGVTDDSHKGPCAVYMKKVSDSSTAEGPGDGWFKVSEDGLDSEGTFCTDRIRLANAPQPGIIPTNIEPGDYLIRAEMITLNNAGPANMGGLEQPQFYTSCSQITVEGTSGTNPDTVSIPGYVSMSSPGMIYDIWNSKSGTYSDYTVPGPAPLENLTPFKAGVAPSIVGGAAPSASATKAASSAPAEYASSAPAAPTSKAADATSVYQPPATSAPAVTSTPASDYSESAPVESGDSEPVESGDSEPVEEAPTEVPAGAIAVTVTSTTFITQYTTVSITGAGAEATATVYETPAEAEPTSTRRHRGNGNGNNGNGRGRAHRRRHHL